MQESKDSCMRTPPASRNRCCMIAHNHSLADYAEHAINLPAIAVSLTIHHSSLRYTPK